MPSQSKANINSSRIKANPPAEEPDTTSLLTEQELGARLGKKKSKNASTKRHGSPDQAADTQTEITSDRPLPQSHTIPKQIPRSFASARRPSSEDVPEEPNATEKVSDEHTPPQHAFSPNTAYGRSPPSELIPGLGYAASPPVQPSYIGQGGFNTRSPPISPPQAKARPVSYGGPPPTSYGYPRLSSSPYGQAVSAYGSPPALPHMPQQHFYIAQDINLGLGAHPPNMKAQPPTFLKFNRLPGSGAQSPDILFAGSDSYLDILNYDGEKISKIGSLSGLPSVVHDAAFLTWSTGDDSLGDFRPLVALALYEATSLDQDPLERPSSRQSYAAPMDSRQGIVSVVVYSLAKQMPVAELLRAPANLLQHPPLGYPEPVQPLKTRLGLCASGDFLSVSFGLSGEVFVFSVRRDESGPRFECLTKFWTSLQPRLQRRDSSHGRSADVSVSMSPADAGRGPQDDLRPILSLNGRWLAYCPPISSPPSIGASLGSSVVCNHQQTILSRNAPSRPSVSCDVESPDADTLLSKMAKGAAQGILRGSKWLGEMGMQAWRNWNTDPSANPQSAPAQRSPVYAPQLAPSQFPPTHADPVDIASTEPDLVSIIDLTALQSRDSKKNTEANLSFATFQPPNGCSFLSFAPNGLTLLSASRKGDCQYVWDLLQIRYPRTTILPQADDYSNFTSRVRQVAKYERFSPSMIVDVQWERPLGHRFAILTRNCTIHMFDLPDTALRWPPPRKAKKLRPVSAPPVNPDTTPQPQGASGWMASARNLANRTQPMLANLRGRTPSMTGGVSGIGTSGIGLASATGMRSGKVVAAGFSKSLGAASDAAAHIRHAGQSKLHLKIEAETCRLVWRKREARSILCVLDAMGVKNYYVRKTNPREGQSETVSVFDARKAVGHRLPDNPGATLDDLKIQDQLTGESVGRQPGFWKPDKLHAATGHASTAPLSHAEIDTNAPYQPFHSDHRVTMSVYTDTTQLVESQLPTVSAIFEPPSRQKKTSAPDKWIFGRDIPTTKLNIASKQQDSDSGAQESVVYRETTVTAPAGEDAAEQIVSTTKKRKAKKRGNEMNDTQVLADQGEVFEDEAEILDFAGDRV